MNKNRYQNIINYSISILIILSSIFLIKNYIDKINYFKIKKIIVTGNNFVSNDDIVNSIDKTLTGNRILNLNLFEIQKHVNKNPFINSSKIFTYFPSTLCIDINEINPIAFYEKNNKIYIIDFNLNSIEANIESLNFFNLPTILEIKNNQAIDYEQASTILKNICENDKNLYSKIHSIYYENLNFNLILENKTKIKLSKENIVKELEVLFSFINTIKNIKEISSYKYIDLTIKNQIIAKEKNIKL